MQSTFTLNIPPPVLISPQAPFIIHHQQKHKSSHNTIPYMLSTKIAPQNFQSPNYPQGKPDSEQKPSKFVKTYVIDYNRHIGNGNFSHVYVAIDQRQPNTKLAVKVVNAQLLREQKLQNLIKSEVDILISLRHQNILFCKDVFWDQTYCYIFTEFCENGSLEQKIKSAQQISTFCPSSQQGHINEYGVFIAQSQNINETVFLPKLTEREMLPLIKDVFQAMIYLEKQHVVHRDIKAANIFLKQNKAIVADFGFARHVYEPFTDLNIGSLPFMPPQSITKNLYSNKTDVWAFGILLFQIFHGESPFAKSKDMNDLAEKVYVPLSVTCIRNDLSIELKQLLLSCLEVDMEKRKKFSELAKTWFCKKLFDSVNPYGVNRPDRLKGNSYHSGRIVTEVPTISFNGEDITKMQKQRPKEDNMSYLAVDCNEYGYGTRVLANGRPFGSRQKQKVNVGNGSMNYSQSYSVNQNDSREKQCKVSPLGIGISIPNASLNRQHSTYSNRGTHQQTLSPGHIPHPIIGLSPQNSAKKQFLNKSSHLAPTNPNLLQSPNLRNVSPTKANFQIVQPLGVNISTAAKVPPQTNMNLDPQNGSPFIQNNFQNQSNGLSVDNNLIINENPFAEKIGETKFEFSPNKNKAEKQEVSFKQVLLRIQQIRNYYKLAIILKDRNKKMTEIKNRLLMKSVKEMIKIENLIQEDKIDLSSYDRSKKDVLQPNDQKAANIKNRKIKLLSIIKDYKSEFENQIKRREILLGQKKGNKKEPQQPLDTLQSPTFSSSSTEEEKANGQVPNFQLKSPTLSQDIQYIIQNEVIHPSAETISSGKQSDPLQYRKKVKEVLDDIMTIENGFLSMPQGSFKGFNKSKEESNKKVNNQLTDSDDLSRLRFKQKSNVN